MSVSDGTRRAVSPRGAKQDDERAARLRCLEAETGYFDASARLVDIEAEKIAGEIAEQELRARNLEARTRREEVETEAVESARFRADVMLVVFLLMVVLALGLGLVDGTYRDVLGGGGLLGATGLAAARLTRFRS